MSTARRVRIFALCALKADFSQVAKNYQVFCQIIGGVFLTFLPKIKDNNSICQTDGDALRRVHTGKLVFLPDREMLLDGCTLGNSFSCLTGQRAWEMDQSALAGGPHISPLLLAVPR